jgi:hypothetical protein
MLMVKAESESKSEEPNAYYDHNRYSPDNPRTMSFFGNGNYETSKDRDMFWHEFGHFINESVSGDRGIDLAGDHGAFFTEGAALHECLADYYAESLGNTPYIGKWIARNFPEIPAGDPLRSAVSNGAYPLLFEHVSVPASGPVPDRYGVAEWCSRVLWQLRSQFLSFHGERGAVLADRLVLSSATLLERDSSVSRFRSALQQADGQLHCGMNRKSIDSVFEQAGFEKDPPQLEKPLQVIVTTGKGTTISRDPFHFAFTITNPTSRVARNVRVALESRDSRLVPIAYMQGFGDLPAGHSISVGADAVDLLPTATIDAPRGTRVPFRIRILVENGQESTFDGEVLP